MIQLNKLLLKNIIVWVILLNIGISKLFATEKPNIIFILADDLGWADLPLYGNQFNEAPNLDRLASEGMRFTNAYIPGHWW